MNFFFFFFTTAYTKYDDGATVNTTRYESETLASTTTRVNLFSYMTYICLFGAELLCLK